MAGIAATVWHFQCPECGYGSVELATLARAGEEHCLICLEEQGRRIVLCWWEEAEAAPVRPASVAA